MALIGKIREKSWLLIAVVGIAMLAFILPEFNIGGGPTEDVYGIGTINGKQVDENYYENVLQNARNQIFQSKMQQNNGQPVALTESDERNARTQAWQAVVSEELIRKEYEKIGLIVDDVELENIMYGLDGFPVASSLVNVQMFKDSVTGEYSPNLVRQYFENLEASNDPEAINQYQSTIDYIKQVRVEEKYEAFLNAGIYTTSLEGKHEYMAQKEVKNVSYVFQNFSKATDEMIGEISDEDIKAYYNKHKNDKKYAQKASRKIAYFAIPVQPNGDDSLRTKQILEKMIPSFEKAKNDSNFVMRFSDLKEYNPAPLHPEGTMLGAGSQGNIYPGVIENEIKNAQPGDVIGPYVDQDFMKLSKVVKFEEAPLATVRHILLSASDDESFDKAQKKADSIIRVIRSKNNFEEMVNEFSEDPGSKSTGGKYENFGPGAMVPEFNDFSFDKPIGTLGSVRTTYGIHIVEVLERQKPNRPVLATVAKKIEVTKSSMDNMNSIASSLIYDIDDAFSGKNIEDKRNIFDTMAIENGYTVRSVTLMDENPEANEFAGNAEGRILRLAYDKDSKEGNLSTSPIKDQERIIIAFLSEVKNEGVPSFEAVKEKMRAEVRKEKQAAYIQEQFVGKDDLEALAKETGARFETEGLTFGAANTAVGREPILIGTAFSGLLDGQMSIPVKGSNGVFVLRVDNTVTDENHNDDFSTEQNARNSQMQSTFIQRYRSALMEGSEIIDNRKLRSFGIR